MASPSTPEGRARHAAYQRARYRADPEPAKARSRKSNRANYLANGERIRAAVSAYQKANREAATIRQAAWIDAHRDHHNEVRAEYRRRDAAAVLARRLLNQAVGAGDVVRQPCEICGSTTAVHGHHAFGYQPENALAVWWLCKPHHQGVHNAMRGAA